MFSLDGERRVVQGVETLTNKISYEEFFIKAIKKFKRSLKIPRNT